VFNIRNNELYLSEIAEEYSLDDIRRNTGCDFKLDEDIKQF
jgi:acyl CoA:acetate/3-ketoacid CoA transferase beta subunit